MYNWVHAFVPVYVCAYVFLYLDGFGCQSQWLASLCVCVWVHLLVNFEFLALVFVRVSSCARVLVFVNVNSGKLMTEINRNRKMKGTRVSR